MSTLFRVEEGHERVVPSLSALTVVADFMPLVEPQEILSLAIFVFFRCGAVCASAYLFCLCSAKRTTLCGV